MNQEERKKIVNWLEQKWPATKRNCDICNQTQWSISEDVVALFRIENSKVNLNGKLYPQIMVTCSSCGNSKMFNIINIFSNTKSQNKPELAGINDYFIYRNDFLMGVNLLLGFLVMNIW